MMSVAYSLWNFSEQLTDVSSEFKLQLEEKPQYFMRKCPCVSPSACCHADNKCVRILSTYTYEHKTETHHHCW